MVPGPRLWPALYAQFQTTNENSVLGTRLGITCKWPIWTIGFDTVKMGARISFILCVKTVSYFISFFAQHVLLLQGCVQS